MCVCVCVCVPAEQCLPMSWCTWEFSLPPSLLDSSSVTSVSILYKLENKNVHIYGLQNELFYIYIGRCCWLYLTVSVTDFSLSLSSEVHKLNLFFCSHSEDGQNVKPQTIKFYHCVCTKQQACSSSTPSVLLNLFMTIQILKCV